MNTFEQAQKSIDVQFCPSCNNLLYPKADEKREKLMLGCRTCGYTQKASGTCAYVNNISTQIDAFKHISPDIIFDPTRGRSKVACPKCKYDIAVETTSETIAWENDMRIYYVCANRECKHIWISVDAGRIKFNAAGKMMF